MNRVMRAVLALLLTSLTLQDYTYLCYSKYVTSYSSASLSTPAQENGFPPRGLVEQGDSLAFELAMIKRIFSGHADLLYNSIVIYESNIVTYGTTAVTLPILAVSLLEAYPLVNEIVVISKYKELLAGLDDRITPISPENLDEITGRKFDFLIDFRMTEANTSFPRALHSIFEFEATFRKTRGRFMPLTLSRVEAYQLFLRLLGLPVPDKIHSPLYKRTPSSEPFVFVNPHGKIQSKQFEYLREDWVNLIIELNSSKKRVLLNAGLPQDTVHTSWIREQLQGQLDHPELFEIRTFEDRRELMKTIGSASGLITIDTGIFHVARLFDTPTVVIADKDDRDWISKPKREDLFHVEYIDTFLSEPGKPENITFLTSPLLDMIEKEKYLIKYLEEQSL